MATYYGVYRVFANGKHRYVSRSATSNEKLAREIAADLSAGRVIMPDGSERSVKAYPHICQANRGERAGMTDTVTRYVATYVNKDGMRTLMRPAQGRNTFETAEEAQAWIDAVTANNSADNVRQVWGENPDFAVRPCACWPGHFDPKGVWFE